MLITKSAEQRLITLQLRIELDGTYGTYGNSLEIKSIVNSYRFSHCKIY